MDAVAGIEANMAEARRARARGDLAAAEQWLERARVASTSVDSEHSIRAIVGWRHLKVLFDLGHVERAEELLSDVISLPAPFAEGSGGFRAAEPVARGIWDRLGYGRPSVRGMWRAYIDAWEEAGDPWMAACGATQLLWELACSGELEQVADAVERIACTTPSRFARGPSRHPQAPDAAGSLPFAQMEQARIAAWASVWAADEGLARVALELYADGLADADVPVDYWFVEAQARCELLFGWAPHHVTRWPEVAAGLVHPRAALHQGLARACCRPAEAVEALAGQVEAADEAGPEWGVDVRRVLARAASRTDDPRGIIWSEAAEQRVRQFGLGVFTR